jgi:hypothetical protein
MNSDIAAVAGPNLDGETFIPVSRVAHEARWLEYSGAGVAGSAKQDLVQSGAVDMKSRGIWNFANFILSIPADDC